jgi:hypothetical protein
VSPSNWLGALGMGLSLTYQIQGAIRRGTKAARARGAFEGRISASMAAQGLAIEQLAERMTSIETFLRDQQVFIKEHMERRRDPADLVSLARTLRQHLSEMPIAAQELTQSIIDQYEPRKGEMFKTEAAEM